MKHRNHSIIRESISDQEIDKLLRSPGALDLFAEIYTDGMMSAAEFLSSVAKMARDRTENDGVEPAVAFDQVMLEIALDFPAVIVAALTGHGDNNQSEAFLAGVLAETQSVLISGKNGRPVRLNS